jgi:AcrR family transcriptional regulator
MGINRPSLYAAFGNKEELFRKALDRYEEGPVSFLRDALAQPTARKVVERFFSGGIELVTSKRNYAGASPFTVL